jgi:hypothetical protein
VRDAIAGIVADDPELLDIYIAGAPENRIVREVACGISGINGVRVVVPPSRFPAMAHRISHWHVTSLDDRQERARFLLHRCDQGFLHELIQQNPSFPESLTVMHYLDSWEEVATLARLASFGLLSEEIRRRKVAAIVQIAVESVDAGFASRSIRPIFQTGEFEELRQRVRDEVIPNLEQFVDEERSNLGSRQNPEDQLWAFRSELIDLKKLYTGDEEAEGMIEYGEACLRQAIESERLREEEDPPDDYDHFGSGVLDGDDGHRSMFDDVDA